ncbi:MAG: VOC family protein [Alphaproteobacteria bacterium]
MSYKPENTPTLIPSTMVRNGEQAITFYQSAFGFELGGDPMTDENGDLGYFDMRYKDALMMFFPENAYGMPHKTPATNGIPSGTSLYLYTEDVDKFYAHAVQNGATSIMEPADMFWGDRMCKVSDPDGNEWTFATHTG